MPKLPKLPQGMPTPQQVIEFIQSSDVPAGKREIAKAFGLINLIRFYFGWGDKDQLFAQLGRLRMGVANAPARMNLLPYVRLAVTIRVFQKKEPRRLGNNNPTPHQNQPGRNI